MKFKRLLAAGCAAASLVGAVFGAAAPALADPLTAADFVQGATLGDASLSPSGRYLVWTVRAGDRVLIQIRDLQEDTSSLIDAGSASEHFGGIFVDWVRWKSDDRLLVGLTRFELRRSRGRETGRINGFTFGQSVVSVARDGSGQIALKAPGTQDALPGEVLDTLRDDPDHILMAYRDFTGGLNVARVNILTGEAVKTLDGHRRVLDYITDRNGAVVGRIAYRGSSGRVLLMEAINPDGQWSEVYRLRRDEMRELSDYQFLGATAEPGKVYVAVQPSAAEGANTAAVHVFDFATRTMGPEI